jgi:hypothetical protein
MSNETKWRIVWASWLAAGIVAETIAIRGGDDKAPLSHHMRRNTHLLGKSQVGQLALLFGAQWLHRHLYGANQEDRTPGVFEKWWTSKILP